jgi:hypothetical protein
MIIDNGLATGSLSISGSLIQSNGNVVISGSLLVSGNTVNNLTASYAINANLLDGLDSTQYTFTSSFNSYTSSINATIVDILIETASLNLLTASLLTYTASINTRTGSLATTGSNTFTGNQIVNGTITAQTLIVQTITSSVSNITGSTRFGSLAANTHQFTGSVSVLGTISGSSIAGSGANLISIPNAALSNSTISGIALGSNLATLTIGTGLSGTSYNGSTGVTISNSGVTSIVAGTGISVGSSTGTVTVTNTITNNNQLTNGAGYITNSTTSLSLTGNLTVSSGNTTGGGIILADDGDIVDLNDGFCAMRFSSGVRIHSGNRTGGAVIRLGNGGDIIASADITAFGSPSDIRLKENIKPLETALDKVLKLQGVTYDWKEDTDARSMTNIKEDIGFIAQQVQEVVPELVRQNNNGFLSLRDKGITALLVEAIKEQQTQIEELKSIINALTK